MFCNFKTSLIFTVLIYTLLSVSPEIRSLADEVETAPEAATATETTPTRELSPAMATMRDRVRKTLASHRRAALNTHENSATEMMSACLPFGCRTNVLLGGPSGRKLNGITCICWNYPCAGYEPLCISGDRIAAKIGYGTQVRPSQFLATLAMARVSPTYQIRVGDDVRTVADLVEHEKLSCRDGTDLSLKLIGLSHFVKEPTWKNDLGEEWSHQRIIKEELSRPIVGAPNGGTDRLMGLSYAIHCREKRKQPIEGQYIRAQKYVSEFHDFALANQNPDGSWGRHFMAAKSQSRSPAGQLRYTGHVLRWLVFSLPEQQLENQRIVRSVEHLNRLLTSGRYRYNVRSLSTREIGSVMHALQALSLYDMRCFKPADAPPEKPAAEVASAK